jgi:hypothetical protein
MVDLSGSTSTATDPLPTLKTRFTDHGSGVIFCQPHHVRAFDWDPIEVYPSFISSDYVWYSFRSIWLEHVQKLLGTTNPVVFCSGVNTWGTYLAEIFLSPNYSWITLWTVLIETSKSELISRRETLGSLSTWLFYIRN